MVHMVLLVHTLEATITGITLILSRIYIDRKKEGGGTVKCRLLHFLAKHKSIPGK